MQGLIILSIGKESNDNRGFVYINEASTPSGSKAIFVKHNNLSLHKVVVIERDPFKESSEEDTYFPTHRRS